ncbi:unnamed protein product [Onchocerca ochengi]|uniref:ANK_REP_REGION domain-containing protein n=1 Tax=Onchocerca ochengi TaxID=42157 RepID=A0A182E060_ONCOC|nr:unnamed protein product [Onchocerca ochengi]
MSKDKGKLQYPLQEKDEQVVPQDNKRFSTRKQGRQAENLDPKLTYCPYEPEVLPNDEFKQKQTPFVIPPEGLNLLSVGDYRKNRKDELLQVRSVERQIAPRHVQVSPYVSYLLFIAEIASTVSVSFSTMKRKKSTLKGLCSGLYRVSTAANESSLNDLETDVDGGVFLLNFEKLNREICRISELSSSSNEDFRSSIGHGSSTNSYQQYPSIEDSVQIENGESAQGPVDSVDSAMIQSNSFSFNSFHAAADVPNSQGITLLHWATANDHVAAAWLLLRHAYVLTFISLFFSSKSKDYLGADFRLTTLKGYSVFHTAVCNNARSCLKLFLKLSFKQEKMDIMKRNDCKTSYKFTLQRDFSGNNLLHLACRLRKKHCLKIVLGFIMKYFGWLVVEEMLQQCNKSNQTPVHVACLWNSVEATNLLLTDNLKKIVNKIYNWRKRNKISAALREASKRTMFWRIGRGTVLHEMATVECNFACFTKNSPSLPGFHNKLGAAELKMYLLSECIATETFEKRCSKCEKAKLKVVRVILRCCPELVLLRDVLGQTALMCSVISGAVSLTKALLVDKGGKESIDPDSRTALHHAAARGKLRQVTILLEYGASIKAQDSYGATPMHYAAIGGFCATLRLLYQANKYTDEIRTNNGHSAFMWAAMNGKDISISTMIDANPVISREDFDYQGCTALHLAAAGDHVEVIDTLLLFKWNAEKRNKLGETPLIVAAKKGSTKAVRRLLRAGIDYSTQDKLNNTAFHVAADSDCKEILRQLVRYMNNPSLLNMRNDMGQTPLHYATEHNAVQCVRYLLRCGADSLMRDNRGWDPLMVAVQQGCWSTIILMLKDSSNINCYSAADNQTTLSLALEKKNYFLASFLETNGAMLANEIQNMAAQMSTKTTTSWEVIWFNLRSYISTSVYRYVIPEL